MSCVLLNWVLRILDKSTWAVYIQHGCQKLYCLGIVFVWLNLGVPILHIIATPFPNQWHKIGDNQNTVHYPTIEKFNKIFRLFVAEYLQLEQVGLWDEAEDGGIVSDDTRTNAKLNSKHTPTTSGGAPSIKMHTEF